MDKYTFEDYLKEPRSLSLDRMMELHRQLMAEVGDDPDAEELYAALLEEATEYAEIRASWPLMSREDRMAKDPSRTAHHNSVISHYDMLARLLRRQGKTADWREELGDEKADRYFRKTMGDFACFLVFINSLMAR